MNAKHILKLMEQHAADARRCYPLDAASRAMFFTAALGADLARCGEPVGPTIRELHLSATNAPRLKDTM